MTTLFLSRDGGDPKFIVPRTDGGGFFGASRRERFFIDEPTANAVRILVKAVWNDNWYVNEKDSGPIQGTVELTMSLEGQKTTTQRWSCPIFRSRRPMPL